MLLRRSQGLSEWEVGMEVGAFGTSKKAEKVRPPDQATAGAELTDPTLPP